MGSLLVIGAGGHGRVVKEIAEACGYSHIAFLDDHSEIAIGKIDQMRQFYGQFQEAFVAIGNNKFREELLNRLENSGFYIPTLIHPTAYVSTTAKIGKGTLIAPMAVVNTGAVIGMGGIISAGAVVDHDVSLGDCVHINVGVAVMSGTEIASYTKVNPVGFVRN